MTDTPRRIFGIICLLVGVWVVTYWLYQPSAPPVTFGERPASLPLAELADAGPSPAQPEPQPEPEPEPQPVQPVTAPHPPRPARASNRRPSGGTRCSRGTRASR
jgi:hypothetical protein